VIRIALLLSVLLTCGVARPLSAKSPNRKIPEFAPLLTPSYGIVGEKERREQAGKGGMVWLCLQVDRVIMRCEENGEDLDELPPRSKLYFDILQIVSGGVLHEFSLRQVSDMENCRLTHRRWKRVLSGQKHACFSAYPDGEMVIPGYKRVSAWAFLDRVISRQGEWTYFVRHGLR
jgi:hypothetical protein